MWSILFSMVAEALSNHKRIRLCRHRAALVCFQQQTGMARLTGLRGVAQLDTGRVARPVGRDDQKV